MRLERSFRQLEFWGARRGVSDVTGKCDRQGDSEDSSRNTQWLGCRGVRLASEKCVSRLTTASAASALLLVRKVDHSMRLEVRRAAIGDEAVLRDLRVQALTDAPEAFGSTLERELARTIDDWRKWLSPNVTFLLLANGTAQGLVAGVCDAMDRTIVHLMAMWVDPGLRRGGGADLLVTAIKDWAAQVGAVELRLNVVESNTRAQRCYERNGFRHTGRRGVLAKSGEAEIEMAWTVRGRASTGAAES